MPVDIGPVGSIGPHGAHRGKLPHIPGLGLLGGLLAAGAVHNYANRHGMRDYNDQPTMAPVQGSVGGTTVKSPTNPNAPGGPGGSGPVGGPGHEPRPRSKPPRMRMPSWYEGSGWDRWDKESTPIEEDPYFDSPEFAERYRESGKENRKVAQEKAPRAKKPRKGPPDLSDLRKGPTG